MTTLQDFEKVRENLKNFNKKSIVALHKYVFEGEGDRGNRQRLRTFEGFDFDENDDRFLQKCEYVDENITAADLTSICMALCISYDKQNLKLHIFKNLRKDNLLGDDDNDDTNDDEDDVNDDGTNNNGNDADVNDDQHGNVASNASFFTATTIQPMQVAPRFTISMRDIEDSVRTFDGSGKISIEVWLEEFEETAILMGLDDLHKLIFGKKLLKGTAALFVKSERGITSWAKLRKLLLNEFEMEINTGQLHKELIERNIKKDEKLQDYFLAMKEIAGRGKMDSKSLMTYVIDGINDLNINKSILYGAKSEREFKEKLKDYELMRAKYTRSSSYQTPVKNVNDKNPKVDYKNKREVICYNCGAKGHVSSDCKNKEQGKKCFNCNKFGHVAKDCADYKSKTSNCQYFNTGNKNMCKEVTVNDIRCSALFDSGCKFNIITDSLYRRLKQVEMIETNIELVGIGENRGQNAIKPIGMVKYTIELDKELYTLKFLVVSSKCLDIEMIIGQDFCQYAEVTINRSGIQIKKNEIYNELSNFMLLQDYETTELELNINPNVSNKAKVKVQGIIADYRPEKTKETNIEMTIVLKDESPLTSRPRRLPFSERSIVDEQVEKWKNDGIIEDSTSEFTSPIVLIRKKDGTPRLCVDYRRLNKVMMKDHFPLPLIEDQLDRLSEASVYSTIDLKNAFFHVSVAEKSRKYTSFITHSGQYQFLKVPFGLSNSPNVFQRYINAIFRDLTRRGVALPYVDDIIIPARNEEDAVQNIEEVMKICKEYGLEINLKKSTFLQQSVEFLGYTIENKTISPAPGKTQDVLNYDVPTNLKKLQSFLGLTGYFRKFVPNYSLIAKPLSDLTKQDVKFQMGPKEIAAFEQLKKIITEKPVLNIYNHNYDTEVHTDASMHGYGAVLLQKSPEDGQLHPVYFMSHKTSERESKFSSYELEILAVIEALKKFRVYLLGRPFKLVTDCDALTKTLDKRDICARVARWVIFLQEFNYTVEHRPAVRMKHVDSLSRYPFMMISDNVIAKLRRAQSQDEEVSAVMEILNNIPNYKGFVIKNDLLHKVIDDDELLVVPKGMQREIIRMAHEQGHFSVRKTKEILAKEYYIPDIEKKIANHISCCVPCIMANRKQGKLEGELCPISKGELPLHTIHLDFLGPLESTSKQYKHILVIIDAFTKFCWLYPTKTTSTHEVISKLKMQSITFGNPHIIITDRGSAFTSSDFQDYCKDENIKHHLITTGLPRANGQVERLNAVVSSVLSKVSCEDPTKWYRHVERVQKFINSSYSRSTGTTPFKLMIGVEMRNKEDVHLKQIVEQEYITQFDNDRRQLREYAKGQIVKIQNENRKGYNLRRKPAVKYQLGDLVAIKRTQFGSGFKLKPKYLGPYKISKVKGNNSYEVIKVGNGEGPQKSTSCAEFIKPWCVDEDPNEVLETSFD